MNVDQVAALQMFSVLFRGLEYKWGIFIKKVVEHAVFFQFSKKQIHVLEQLDTMVFSVEENQKSSVTQKIFREINFYDFHNWKRCFHGIFTKKPWLKVKVWKSRHKHDHCFYWKINTLSVKSKVFLKKLLKRRFHGNFWGW